ATLVIELIDVISRSGQTPQVWFVSPQAQDPQSQPQSTARFDLIRRVGETLVEVQKLGVGDLVVDTIDNPAGRTSLHAAVDDVVGAVGGGRVVTNAQVASSPNGADGT